MSLPAISQHLQVLCDVELVSQSRSGRQRLPLKSATPQASIGLGQSIRAILDSQTRCVGRTWRKPMNQNCNIEVFTRSPERVWQALIDRRALAAWMMDNDFLSRD